MIGFALGIFSVWISHVVGGAVTVESPETENPIVCSLSFEDLPAAPMATVRRKVVQSSVVNFSKLGKVEVKAVETLGQRPQMEFSSAGSHKKLLVATIKDTNDLLYPVDNDDGRFGPFIRYRVLNNTGLDSPVVMSVVVYPGGSDDGFYLSIFTEIAGRIVNLTPRPRLIGVQGGWYLGFLGKKYGYGLAEWTFIWHLGDEAHYSAHHYGDEIDTLVGTHFVQTFRRTSKHKYDPAYGYKSFGEIGVNVKDQRAGIPYFRDYLELEP